MASYASLPQDRKIEVFMKMIDSLGYGAGKASTFDVLPAPATSAGSALRRWNWHYRALIKARERLLKQRAALAAVILDHLESFSLHMADAATDQFDHDVAQSLISAEQDTLFEVEAALRRIRAGTYGLCELTAKPIPAARLRAIPWTRFCLEIEEQLEEHSACRPPHLGELKSVHAQVSFDRPMDVQKEEGL
jgi:RNA polymerase-binding transcription factor DksA